MKSNKIFILSVLALWVLSTFLQSGSAEAKGFMIYKGEEGSRVLEGQEVPSFEIEEIAPQDEANFFEAYQQEEEQKKLYRKIEKQERHIENLKEKLGQEKRVREDLEIRQSYLRSEGGRTYEVKKGDSLWKISGKEQIYNNPYLWVKIYNANMDRIKDPDLIFPGQQFRIPE